MGCHLITAIDIVTCMDIIRHISIAETVGKDLIAEGMSHPVWRLEGGSDDETVLVLRRIDGHTGLRIIVEPAAGAEYEIVSQDFRPVCPVNFIDDPSAFPPVRAETPLHAILVGDAKVLINSYVTVKEN